MASGRHLRDLIAAYVERDDAAVRGAAEAIIAEERAKNNRLLADDLEALLHSGRKIPARQLRSSLLRDVPKDRETGIALVDVSEPDYDWDRLVLSPGTLRKLQRITEEHHRRDILAAAGLKPTRRVLFYGPPGCGKSISASVVAGVLSRPLVTVRLDALISSYLGETASNLRRVFDFVQRDLCVALFDEFDAIGKDRDNQFEHGELKRLVNSLLQLMDSYGDDSLLIASTNHEKLLDNAAWRRFEAVVAFGRPPPAARARLLRKYLKAFDTSELCVAELAQRLRGMSGADIELVATDAARCAVLDGRITITRADIEPAISDLTARLRLSTRRRESGSMRSDDTDDDDWSLSP